MCGHIDSRLLKEDSESWIYVNYWYTELTGLSAVSN